MNHDGHEMSGPPQFPADYPRCALYGNGTYRYGHYKPTGAELTYCQTTNDPWAGQFKYAYYTSYFLAACTVVFIFARVIKHDRALRSLCAKPLAVARFATYPFISKWLPPLGGTLLILAFAAFSGGYTFINRVYARPANFGSWPIGLRPGWIATAMLPWVYALAAKRNFLSCLTAVSHEKMQVAHQYGGWILFILSFIHTVALQIRAMIQEPWSYTWANNALYRSGYAALSPLAVLSLLSFPFIRRRWYEAFFVIHFLAAAFFAWWMTNHVSRMMGSQYYCYAAIAVWSAALIWRHGAVLFGLLRHLAVGQGLPRARIEILPGDLIKLTVRTKMSWKPGQHIFLRVLTCRPVETHPFTIASLPGSSSFSDAEKVQATDGLSDLVLLIRPENGFTRSLFSLVKAELAADREAQVPILIDGPYGEAVDVRTFDSVLLIAGGTGISFVLPVLRDVIDAPRTTRAMKKIRMVWAARDATIFEQFRQEIGDSLRSAPEWMNIEIDTHVTTASGASDVDDSLTDEDVKSMERAEAGAPVISYSTSRPDVKSIIYEIARAVNQGRLAIGACGPESLLVDIRMAAAECQKRILSGSLEAEEVALHSELFAW